MKIKISLLISMVLAVALLFFHFPFKKQALHDADGEMEKDKIEKPAYHIKARAKYEFDMVKDPATGKIPENIVEKERAFARQMPLRSAYGTTTANGTFRPMAANTYLPAGPNNIGGRTRAVEYDKRFATTRVIIAGCVSGGIMRSTDGGLTWSLVTPSEDIHSLTALVQDPRPGFQDTWYAGSGEFLGNSASQGNASPYLGYGLWKSTNNGASWTKLPMTITNVNNVNNYYAFDHPFDFTYNLAINPLNGDLYVSSWVLLLKSTNGGSTFRAVYQSATSANAATGQMHVTVSNTGRVYLAVNGGANDAAKRGVLFSETGELNSWTRIAGGATLGTDSVAGWRGNSYTGDSKRILITLAPSNNNIGYVFYENGLSSDPPTSGGNLAPEADLFRFEIPAANATNFTWSNRSANMPDLPGGNRTGSDPLTVQGGYDMEVAVKPDDPNAVFIGGTNLYRSTDGFATSTNTTWIGGYATNFTYFPVYPNSHPDFHRLVFHPNNPNRAITANDGGIQETGDVMAATVAWTMLPNYQTLQCYNVAIDPGAGRNNFVSGSQDNGVRLRDKTGLLGTPAADSNNHRVLLSADGAYVGLSLDNAGTQYVYESVQYGRLFRARLNSSFQSNFGTDITPAGLTTAFQDAEDEFGEFVTNFRLESDNTDNLYYINFNRLFRTTAASTVTPNTWTELTGVSTAVNPGSPTNGRNVSIRGVGYSRGPYATSHALYIGTTNGKIFRLDDPKNAPPTTAPIDITPAGLTGNVQDIAVNPNNDDEVIAVVSNYNVVSIWWTKNAKAATPTWKNGEGNLTLPSARSCAIVVKKDAANQPITEYYVGTSAGLYSTVNLGTVLDANQAPVWLREGGQTLNLAVVASLAYRPVDNVLLVGTHGNGIFYTFLGTPNFTPNLNTGITPVTNDRNFIRTVYPTASASDVQYQIGNMLGVRKISVQLLNLKGQVVYQESKGYQSGSIPLQRMASGVYIVNILSEDNKYRHVQKIVRL